MSQEILTSNIDGNLFIKLSGDFRIPESLTIFDCLIPFIDSDDYKSCFFDLSSTNFMDSTALGLIAKLGINSCSHIDKNPNIIIENDDIIRSFSTMGLINHLFHLIKEKPCLNTKFCTSKVSMPSEACAQQLILDAHQTLVEVDYKNFDKFEGVINSIKKEMH